jgi:hypothetical protein
LQTVSHSTRNRGIYEKREGEYEKYQGNFKRSLDKDSRQERNKKHDKNISSHHLHHPRQRFFIWS